MKIALWLIQILLALVFFMAGLGKVSTPYNELAQQMAWVADASPGLVVFIGVAEIAGALGLILPAITRILPWLTPLAAAGLSVIMILASGLHLIRGEFGNIIANLIILALAAFVAYGRWKLVPIEARS